LKFQSLTTQTGSVEGSAEDVPEGSVYSNHEVAYDYHKKYQSFHLPSFCIFNSFMGFTSNLILMKNLSLFFQKKY